MKITVIGGTGLIGSKVVAKLGAMGHEALAAAPNTGVDTLTGEGLDAAFEGASVVVDLSNSPSFEDQAAMDFFVTSGRNIAAAERRAGIRHHAALSVVGTDRLQASGYFRAKQKQEEIIAGAGVPYSLLHATQFFEFLRGIAQSATDGSEVRLAHAMFQPMAAEDVASAVTAAALAEPLNGMREICGPRAYPMDALVARVLAHDKDQRIVARDDSAPYFGVVLSERDLMPGPDAKPGTTSFDWWLENVPPPAKR